MSQRQSTRYLRTASHSSQVISSFELEEKQHPIQSMSDSVHHTIPSSVDPSSNSDHPPLNTGSSQSKSLNINAIQMTSNPSNSYNNNIPDATITITIIIPHRIANMHHHTHLLQNKPTQTRSNPSRRIKIKHVIAAKNANPKT